MPTSDEQEEVQKLLRRMWQVVDPALQVLAFSEGAGCANLAAHRRSNFL
jgi:hypothetical protein